MSLAGEIARQGDDDIQNQFEVQVGLTPFLGDANIFRNIRFRVTRIVEPEINRPTYTAYYKGVQLQYPSNTEGYTKDLSISFRGDKNKIYRDAFDLWGNLVKDPNTGVSIPFVSSITSDYNYATDITVSDIDEAGIVYGSPRVYRKAWVFGLTASQRDSSNAEAVPYTVQFHFESFSNADVG